MNAAHIGRLLSREGVHVQRTQEGDESVDGAVYITDLVHVQVPTFGADLNVVSETGEGHLLFGRPRRLISELVADIREALGMQVHA